MKRCLVVGLGKFGRAVAETLVRGDAEVIAVDDRMELVDQVKGTVAYAAQADATEPEALRALEAGRCDVAVVTFGEDFEASVLAVTALKQVGVPHVVARAASDREARILELVGASQVIQLESDMGRRLAQAMLSPVALELFELSASYAVAPWEATGELVGRDLADAAIRAKYGLQVLGLRRGADERKAVPGRVRLEVPGPDYVIREGDVLMLGGLHENVARFLKRYPSEES